MKNIYIIEQFDTIHLKPKLAFKQNEFNIDEIEKVINELKEKIIIVIDKCYNIFGLYYNDTTNKYIKFTFKNPKNKIQRYEQNYEERILYDLIIINEDIL